MSWYTAQPRLVLFHEAPKIICFNLLRNYETIHKIESRNRSTSGPHDISVDIKTYL